MQFSNFNAVASVKNIEELEALLTGDDAKVLWLWPDDAEYPKLSILARNNLAVIHYMPVEFEAGYQSLGTSDESGISKLTKFSLSENPADDVEVTSDAVVCYSIAISAAKQFFHSTSLLTAVKWFEL